MLTRISTKIIGYTIIYSILLSDMTFAMWKVPQVPFQDDTNLFKGPTIPPKPKHQRSKSLDTFLSPSPQDTSSSLTSSPPGSPPLQDSPNTFHSHSPRNSSPEYLSNRSSSGEEIGKLLTETPLIDPKHSSLKLLEEQSAEQKISHELLNEVKAIKKELMGIWKEVDQIKTRAAEGSLLLPQDEFSDSQILKASDSLAKHPWENKAVYYLTLHGLKQIKIRKDSKAQVLSQKIEDQGVALNQEGILFSQTSTKAIQTRDFTNDSSSSKELKIEPYPAPQLPEEKALEGKIVGMEGSSKLTRPLELSRRTQQSEKEKNSKIDSGYESESESLLKSNPKQINQTGSVNIDFENEFVIVEGPSGASVKKYSDSQNSSFLKTWGGKLRNALKFLSSNNQEENEPLLAKKQGKLEEPFPPENKLQEQKEQEDQAIVPIQAKDQYDNSEPSQLVASQASNGISAQEKAKDSISDIDIHFLKSVMREPGEGDNPKDIQNLPPKAKAQLQRIIREDVNGEITKAKILGFIVGTGVAGWLTYGMSRVFDSGVIYLGFNYQSFATTAYNEVMNAVPPFVIPTVILDAWPRNVNFWQKALTSLRDGEYSKGRLVGTSIISFWPSILEPFYLILLDLEFIGIIDDEGLPSYKKRHFIKDMLIWSWPLLIDSWAANGSFAWGIWDDLKEQKIPSAKKFLAQHILHSSLHTRLLSEDALLRQEFSKKLDKLSYVLYHTSSKETIKTIYGAVKGAKTEIQGKFPDLIGDELQNAEGFFTLRYLLSISDHVEDVKTQVKSWYDVITEGITGFNLITGSPARLFIFELIVESITDLVHGHAKHGHVSWLHPCINWGLAIGISLIQTVYEAYGQKAFFKDFLAQEEPHGHTIYKGARLPAKVYAATIALIYTSLLAITGLQVCDKWDFNYDWMIASVPFLFAEFATQAATQWGWSSQQEVSFFARFHNLTTRQTLKKEPRTQFKRDELIEFIKILKGRIPYLNPNVIQTLTLTLNSPRGGFEEID